MLKRPVTWLFVTLAGLVALTYYIGRTQVTAPHSLNTGVKAPNTQPKEGDSKQAPAATQTKDQPPANKYEKDCTDPQKRDECIIQLRTAEATEAQARYTQWSLYLVGATIALTLGTVIAGFLTLGTMRNTAEKQLRAYVFAKPGNIVFENRIPRTLYFEVTNTGQTPAYNLTTFNALIFLPYPLPPTFNPGPPDDGSGQSSNVLGPGDTRPCERALGKPMTPQMETQLRAGTRRWYCFIYVRYQDAFRRRFFGKRTRTSRMCASVSGAQTLAAMALPPGGALDCQWDFHEDHNGAD